MGWLLLALNTENELDQAFIELFSNKAVLTLYSRDDSYFWKNRKQVMEAIQQLKHKDLFIDCPLIKNFETHITKRMSEITPAATLKKLKSHDGTELSSQPEQEVFDEDEG